MELRIIDRWARVGQCDACREQRAVYRVELRRPCGSWLGQVCRYCGCGMRLTLRLAGEQTIVQPSGTASAAVADAVTVES